MRTPPHDKIDAATYRATVAKLPKVPCNGCGKDLGPEQFLGDTCGRCCHANHRRACGKG